jgi:hypothetical protein
LYSDDQIPVIFPGETGVPFIIALPSEDLSSVQQAVFMVPPVDYASDQWETQNTPVLLWVYPTEVGSLNGASIPVPVVSRFSERGECSFDAGAALAPYIIPIVSDVDQTIDMIPGGFQLMAIPITPIPSPIETVVREIGFHWPIRIENASDHSTTGLLVIPLPLRSSDKTNPPTQLQKSAASPRLRQVRWQGPDLVPSPGTVDTRERVDGQNRRRQIDSETRSEEEDF